MGALANLVIFLIALQAILVLFEGSSPEATALWDVAMNPFEWNSLTLISEIVLIAAALGAAGILAGNVLGIKTGFMIYAVLVGSLLAFGAVISQFAGVIGKYACNIFCEADIIVAADTWFTCPPAVWLVTITAGALSLYYIFAVLDWWSNR